MLEEIPKNPINGMLMFLICLLEKLCSTMAGSHLQFPSRVTQLCASLADVKMADLDGQPYVNNLFAALRRNVSEALRNQLTSPRISENF